MENIEPARLVILIGSPRSGTTWLQSMIGSHPDCATPQKTDLFQLYIKPLLKAWDSQLEWRDESIGKEFRRAKGLPLTITESEFIGQLRSVVDFTVESVHSLKPGAKIVVEKSPSHSLCVPEILRVVPNTTFIHIIRDGRAVAASLVAAGKDGWGKRWAPTTVSLAAWLWKNRLFLLVMLLMRPADTTRCVMKHYRGLRVPSNFSEFTVVVQLKLERVNVQRS